MHSYFLESASNIVCPDYTTKAAIVLQTNGSPQTASISEKITTKTASTYVFFKSVLKYFIGKSPGSTSEKIL